MKISREVKTAILVISGLLLIIYLFNYLKGENLLDSSRTFYVVYDNVEGVVSSTPVTINGNPVGKVQEIAFTEDGSGKLRVKLLVDSDFQFSKNSRAELYEAGLIGGKAIAIIPVFDDSGMAKDGDELKGGVKAGLTELVNQKLTPLQEELVKVMENANTFLTNLNQVFDEKTKTSLKGSITELNSMLASFNKISKTLDVLITNNEVKLDSTLANFKTASANLASVTDEIAKANLSETIKDLQSTLSSVKGLMQSIDKGEGSMGKLMKDDALYNNLEGATKELEELLRDIKLHPKRYFRILSKKEIPYKKD